MQVTSNQLKRQEDESRRHKEDLETSFAQNKDYQSKLKDERRRYSDLESKLKEDSVHARIKDAEKSQVQTLWFILGNFYGIFAKLAKKSISSTYFRIYIKL